jgi:hypothetical protein
MAKVFKMVLLAALAVALFGAHRDGAAQETQSSKGIDGIVPARDTQIIADITSAIKEVLESTYNEHGVFNSHGIPAETYTAIGAPLTVVCTGTTGTCSIQADMWIQNGGSNTVDNQNIVCLYVDGTASQFCQLWSGRSPADGGYSQATSSERISGLKPGNHKVQTYFLSHFGVADVAYYNYNYRVYKP